MPGDYAVIRTDARWLLENYACAHACPVNTRAGEYISAIAQGDTDHAHRIAREPNPFAAVCGRICTHPCESACRRGRFDAPVSIRGLKRFATERGARPNGPRPGPHPAFGPKVAVIGAGPAGLTAAHDLAALGYRVTIFEASPVVGGMMHLGIPEYRLPREVIRREVEAILDRGVELKLNSPVGPDFRLADLKSQGFEAILIAAGAIRGRDLTIEGVHLDGVLKGVEFLLNVNLGFRMELGSRIVVVGGGGVAVDVARTALREALRREDFTGDEMTLAVDAARAALRMGAETVSMLCLESREEMPAHSWEVEAALEEGIRLHPRRGIRRILGANGRVAGIEAIEVASVFDEAGRFAPRYTPGTEARMDCDTIILAIGQQPDLGFLQPEDGIALTSQGFIQVDRDTLETSAPGIFAAGDVAFGPKNLIEVVADGHRVARGIHAFLSTDRQRRRPSLAAVEVACDLPRHARDSDALRREPIPTLPLHRRIGVAEVELGYDEAAARREAARCLQCWRNIFLVAERCVLCGACAEVCPHDCIRLASLGRIRGINPPANGSGVALILDEAGCIRCGLCVRRCPAKALRMVELAFGLEAAHAL
jgi:NADPH-dependent glutamate synthase beta subunit-like oxidoreductase/NAD-dependent dihydropyrimidine dehydrogenase PreA subunit